MRRYENRFVVRAKVEGLDGLLRQGQIRYEESLNKEEMLYIYHTDCSEKEVLTIPFVLEVSPVRIGKVEI